MGKRILVTGADGFIGSHLMDRFRGDAVGTFHRPTVLNLNYKDLVPCDVANRIAVEQLIRKFTPDVIYHMAAQSYPVIGQEIPGETMHVNAGGTINVFEAIVKVKRSQNHYDPMVIVACSSAEYGAAIGVNPIKEDNPLMPMHVYGVSKVAQDMLAYQYWINNRIRCIRARIFNTTGPRKQGDLISDLVARFVRADKMGDNVIPVGNTHTVRTYLDVRDLIKALHLLAISGIPGEVYNIGSGDQHTGLDIIKKIQKFYPNIDYDQVTTLKRQNDEPAIVGDITRLRDLGWRQEYNIGETIKAMIDHERKSGG